MLMIYLQQCCATELQIKEIMANRVEGVSEKLMSCALEEFLTNGYTGASLRTISENAGTTPRSIYTRYGDKEGLFSELVEKTASEIKDMFESINSGYHLKSIEEQKKLFHDESFEQEYDGYIQAILDYMYDHWNEFRLLICCSEGTKFAYFLDEVVDIIEKYTLLYIEHTGNDVITSGRAKPQLVHLLCSSFVHGFFEIVRHDMEKADAAQYVQQLQRFFTCGWDDLFNPEN